MLDATVPAQETQTAEVEGKTRDMMDIAWMPATGQSALQATWTQLAPDYLKPALDNRSSTYIVSRLLNEPTLMKLEINLNLDAIVALWQCTLGI